MGVSYRMSSKCYSRPCSNQWQVLVVRPNHKSCAAFRQCILLGFSSSSKLKLTCSNSVPTLPLSSQLHLGSCRFHLSVSFTWVSVAPLQKHTKPEETFRTRSQQIEPHISKCRRFSWLVPSPQVPHSCHVFSPPDIIRPRHLQRYRVISSFSTHFSCLVSFSWCQASSVMTWFDSRG